MGSYPRELGSGQALRPLGPTWPGEEITTQRDALLVMGRATAAPNTFWVPPARYIQECLDAALWPGT